MSIKINQLASGIEKLKQASNRLPVYPVTTEEEAIAVLAHIEQLQGFVKAFEAHFISDKSTPSILALMDMSVEITIVNTGKG